MIKINEITKEIKYIKYEIIIFLVASRKSRRK